MVITESNVETRLKTRVEGEGGIIIKLPASLYEGIPDRMVLMPKGQIAFVELKRPKGGVLAPLQKHWIKRLHQLGYRACVVKNYNEIESLIADMVNDGEEEDE